VSDISQVGAVALFHTRGAIKLHFTVYTYWYTYSSCYKPKSRFGLPASARDLYPRPQPVCARRLSASHA